MIGYTSLNDAQSIDPVFKEGTRVKVWYVRDEYHRNYNDGIRKSYEYGENFDLNKIEKTHVLLGTMAGDPVIVSTVGHASMLAAVLQGAYWSPNAQARSLIEGKGLFHTSFSQGDIIQIDDHFFTADGWAIIEFDHNTFK